LPEFRNPNLQGPGPGGSPGGGSSGGEMRMMLAFTVLALGVLLAFEYFKPKPAEPAPSQQPAQAQSAQPQASAPAQTQANAVSTAAPAASTPTITATSESETTVENEWYRITFSNRGGEVKHWILKHYYDTGGQAGGHNLDLVQPQAAARFGYPLSLYTYDSALTAQLHQALFQVSATGSSTANGTHLAPGTLTFHYAQNGLDAVKTIGFDSSYVVTVETEVKRNGEPVRALVEWPAGLGDMEEFLPSSDPAARTRSQVPTSASSQISWSEYGKQTTEGPVAGGFLFWSQPGVSDKDTINGPFQYAAISDLYFAAAFLPDDPERATLVTLHNSLDVPSNLSDPGSQKRPAHVLGLAVGDTSGDTRLRLYAGPKAMDTLASIHAIGADGKPAGQSLKPLIQFGWLTVIAEPLYLGLRFLYEHGIPNWGWAIIVITTIFYLALLPTRLTMMKSSLKMMRIQPKVDALKKKYAHLKINDPKRTEMNTEMMELYKNENINMYGSCWPMLLQMPLFFAYYRVLANVIELRQAHWFWLTDLSMPDPLHILPILIILTMFLTQYMTPSPGMDPAQRRMMAFLLPLIFGYSMLHFPSGLALYWSTGNIINLILQVSINRSRIGKEMHAIAEKRARKGGPANIKGKR
jgi:YidC/Oxa1 family membrane protein insertase